MADAEASSNSDAEVLAALLPAMATIPNALLLAGGSPPWPPRRLVAHLRAPLRQAWARAGLARSKRVMNPLLPASEIERAYAADPARAACEYDAEFRYSTSSLIDADVLQAASRRAWSSASVCRAGPIFAFRRCRRRAGGRRLDGARHQPPRRAHCGSRSRSRAEAALRPERVVTGFARILQSYGLRSVQADRHGRGPFAEAFLRHGVSYAADGSGEEQPLSPISSPAISSGSIRLLDLPRLREQILALESQGTAGGYEKIGMPRARDGKALRDDIVNAAAGALARAGARRRMTVLEGLAVEGEGISQHDRGLANHLLSLRLSGSL